MRLLPIIRRFIDQRPPYGYRRIAALLNRERANTGLPLLNRKWVHRIMQCHAMLLERYTGKREGRIHNAKVRVMRSNLRWFSNSLEFTCWNGDVVGMAFIIEAFNRQIIAWCAGGGTGISGSDVRDMMPPAVENRFGGTTLDRASLGQWQSLQ